MGAGDLDLYSWRRENIVKVRVITEITLNERKRKPKQNNGTGHPWDLISGVIF